MTVKENHVRYQDDWIQPFHAAAAAVFRPGMVVLDIGGGRRPAIDRADLPVGTRYVGLDLSVDEMRAAPAGSYDEMIEADATEPVSDLRGSVDLAVSWQLLEHVTSMKRTLDNVHSYLRPGGRLVAQLSGGRALFALINRAVPRRLAVTGMSVLLRRDPATVFPAPYDACTYTALSKVLAGWSHVTIVPRYRGADYFDFMPALQRVYLSFEDSLARGRHVDLATHYLVIADR